VKSKTTNFTFRRAETKDAQAIASLFADEAMLAFTDVPPHSSVAYWEKRIAALGDAAHLPLVAVADNTIAGVLLLQGWPNHIRRKHGATITLLAVALKQRRSGVGRALVNAAIRACDEWLNVRRIEVAIDDDSAPLKRYYQSFGFVEEGVKASDLLRAGHYVGARVMARVNERVMPAPASPALTIAKRRKSAPLKLTIRAGSEDDATQTAAVFSSRNTAAGTLQHPYTSPDVWRGRLATASTRQCFIVALVKGKQVGNAGVHPVSDNPRQQHVCAIGLGVVDAYQSRGVGRALMETCLDYADNWANYARVELSVHADNTRAIKLYESLGFVVEGRHRDFSFREGGYVDALFMGRVSKALRFAPTDSKR
jgi:L-phenylalanine/L-methionine N-acetyltransferase